MPLGFLRMPEESEPETDVAHVLPRQTIDRDCVLEATSSEPFVADHRDARGWPRRWSLEVRRTCLSALALASISEC